MKKMKTSMIQVMIRKTVLAALFWVAAVHTTAMAEGYSVELIFFEHNYPDVSGEHFFPAEVMSPLSEGGLSLFGNQPDDVPGYQALSENELVWHKEYGLLYRSSEYQPIWHGGWRQPALRKPQGISLRTITLCGGSLSGAAHLRDKGSLHMDLKLRYQPCPTNDDDGEKIWSIRVEQERKVLLNRLYYLDHPMLGILLEVRRN